MSTEIATLPPSPSQLPEPGDRIDLAQAAQECGVSVGTFRRWLSEGVLCGDRRIKPRHIFVGGRIRTTKRWVDDFVRAVTEGRGAHISTTDDNRARQANAVCAATGW